MDEIEELIEKSKPNNTPDSTDPISKLIEQSKPKNLEPSIVVGYNTPIGESKRLEKGFLPNMRTNIGELNVDLENYRSENQWWIEKFTKGVGRVGNKVVSELLKVPGYLVGGLAALGQEIATGGEANSMEMFVNNAWIRGIRDYEEFVNKEILPVHTRKAVAEGNIWKALSSIDFWATEGADGLGFMLPMMFPGAAISKMGLGSKLLSSLGKSEKGLKFLTKVDDISKQLGLESAAASVDLTTATLVNTIFEAGSEANGIMESIERLDGETDEQFEERRATAARNVFMSNLGILLLPNAILNKQVIGALDGGKSLNKFKLGDNNRILNELKDIPLEQKLWKYGKILPSNLLREGFFEEGMQSTMEEYFKNHEDINLDEIMSTYLEVLGTVEGQKAIALGGLFGSGANVFGEFRKGKVEKEQVEKLSSLMNQGINLYEASLSGIYKKDSNGNIIMKDGKPEVDMQKVSDLGRSQFIAQQRNEALNLSYISNDLLTTEMLQNQLQTELALTYAKAGKDGIDLLKQQLEQSETFKENLSKTNQLRESLDKAQLEKNEAISYLINKAENIKKEYDFFKNYGKSLVNIKTTKENRKYIPEFLSRVENAYLKTKSNLSFVNEKQKELENLKQKIVNDLKDQLDETEENLEYTPIISNLSKQIDNLKEYKESLKKNYKKLLDAKENNKEFKNFIEDRKKINELSEELDNAKEEEKENKEVERVNEEQETIIEDEITQQETINEAKSEVNDKYNEFDEKIKNISGYILRGEGESSGMINEKGDLYYPNGLPKSITKLFPGNEKLSASKEIIISKEKTNKGETYNIFSNKEKIFSISSSNINPDNSKRDNTLVDEDINNLDFEYENISNLESLKEIEANQTQLFTGEKGDKFGKGNKKIIERKSVKLVESNDTLITSSTYDEFRENPIDKTNKQVNFMIGHPGTNKKADKAISLYEKIKDNEDLQTKDNIKFLVDYLPIRVIFGEGIYTQLFFKNDITDASDLSKQELKLKESLVQNLLNNVPIENLISKIEFQFPGWIQNDTNSDGSPANNSVLELKQIDNNLSKVEFIYSDKNGKLRNLDKEIDNELSNDTKLKNKGSIFIKLKGANGKIIPIKLNIRRINEKESDLILMLTEKLLNPDIKIGLKSKVNEFDDILNLVNEDFSEELKSFGLNKDNVLIHELLYNFIYEGSTRKNMFKIKGKYLTYGSNKIEFKDFQENREDIKNWLINEKNRNIKVSKLKEKAYKKYLLENKILSTDIKLGDNEFKQNTSIYISPNIENSTKEDSLYTHIGGEKVIDNVDETIKNIKKTSKKRKSTAYKKGKNKIDSILKKGDNNSNTIC